MIKAVLFDIDGTLVNSLRNYVQAYKRTLNDYGLYFNDDEIPKRCFAKTEEQICQELNINATGNQFREKYFGYIKEGIPKLQLFPDTEKTLARLKNKQIKIGIITFAHSWYIPELAKQFSFLDYALVILSFNDVKNSKPDPEAIYLACKKLLVTPEEALMVGDSKSDIQMGRNAGSKTALYIPRENEKFYNFEDLKKSSSPDFAITTLEEIISLI